MIEKETILFGDLTATLYTSKYYKMYGHKYLKCVVDGTGECILICTKCNDAIYVTFTRRQTLSYMYGGAHVKLKSVRTGKPYRKNIRTCDEVKMDEALG